MSENFQYVSNIQDGVLAILFALMNVNDRYIRWQVIRPVWCMLIPIG